MNYEFDLHTHTIASGHAYSTIKEMANSAKEKGLKLLGITEHAPTMPGTCHEFYFQNFRVLDRSAYALPILFGAELNILDENGSVDLPLDVIETLDIAIASLHPPCVRFMTEQETTHALISIMKNPNVQIIGHPDDSRFPINYEELARAAKDTNTLLEVNNSSLREDSYRPGAKDNYKRMLDACVKFDTPIVLDSDAHIDKDIAFRKYSTALIEECKFPESLILNTDVNKLTNYLSCDTISLLKL
ncbi:MAG: phosphatase [Lachnospiraceae bacterium]|nr:phosphatase [Lachnospiraceae bacterium]